MTWLRLAGGAVLLLVGVIWMLQGFNLVKGSGMSGHGEWVFGGLIVVLFGLWLLWGLAAPRLRLTR